MPPGKRRTPLLLICVVCGTPKEIVASKIGKFCSKKCYSQSSQYKAYQIAYRKSKQCKVSQKKYIQTIKGKATRNRYNKKPSAQLTRRKAQLKFLYGLSLEQYTILFNKQSGLCKICNRHQSVLKSKLCIDHDHVTNQIRGLLCKRCNSVLGLMEDNSKILLASANYLEKFYGSRTEEKI